MKKKKLAARATVRRKTARPGPSRNLVPRPAMHRSDGGTAAATAARTVAVVGGGDGGPPDPCCRKPTAGPEGTMTEAEKDAVAAAEYGDPSDSDADDDDEEEEEEEDEEEDDDDEEDEGNSEVGVPHRPSVRKHSGAR